MLILNAFKRLHYLISIISQCVRWYLAYSLSLRNLEEMMAERGIEVDHSTLHRWILRITPIFNKILTRYKKSVNPFWHIDEPYIKIKGAWHYLYRAIDSEGKTVDFLLMERRDAKAARRFLNKAIHKHICPAQETIDKSGANKKAVENFNSESTRFKPITIRQNKYMNNRIEQDHRFIKKRVKPMLGFKSFRSAKIILSGIELMHMLRKGQFNLPEKTQKSLGSLCPKIW